MIFNYPNYIIDKIRLLVKIRPSRLWNYLKILLSYFVSSQFKKVCVWAYPFSLSLETASVCNLSCPECLAGIKQTHRNRKLMDVALIENKLALHKSNAFYCNLYAQGEPFLHTQLDLIIKLTGKYGYYSAISTNGHFLDEKNCFSIIHSKLDKLIVSLDGIDPQAYMKYRKGGDFDKVTQGIKRLSAMRKELKTKHPLLVVQFLVHKSSEGQLNDAQIFVKALGADVLQFKSMQIYSSEGKEDFLPKNKDYNRYDQPASKRENSPVPKSCFRIWSHMSYISDGVMIPCCYDKVPEYAIGSEEIQRGDLWKSPAMQNFRRKLLNPKQSISLCENCFWQ